MSGSENDKKDYFVYKALVQFFSVRVAS